MNISEIVKTFIQSSSIAARIETENPASLNRKYMKHNFSDYKHFGEYNETQWRLQRIYVQLFSFSRAAANLREDD